MTAGAQPTWGAKDRALVLFAKQVDTIAELVRMRPTHNDFKNDQVIALSELASAQNKFWSGD